MRKFEISPELLCNFEFYSALDYVMDICFIGSAFCSFNSHFCQTGLKRCQLGSGNCYPDCGDFINSLGVAFFRGETKEISLVSKQGLLFLVLSGMATGLSWLFYFKALQLGKVSQVASVDKLSLAMVSILSVLFLGEPLNWKIVSGGLLIITGTVILIL